MNKPATKADRTPPYPALAVWRRREADKPTSRWTYDDLWRAAMAEAEAAEQKNPKREHALQREAVAVLLGEPLHKVRLTRETMRRYLKVIATYDRKVAA